MSNPPMNEKSRAPIDLDEFERQLREMQARPKMAVADPLAELARIVGQDDPFRLSSVKPETRGMLNDAERNASAAEPMAGELPRRDGRGGAFSPLDELASISAPDDFMQGGPAPDFLSARAAREADDDQPPTFAPSEPAPRRSRAGVAIFVGLVACGLAGVGAVWSLSASNRSSAQIASADVPVIQPKPGPVKERPADPGGLTIPDQKTAVLEKAKEDLKKPPTIVPREEQPVDLAQAAKKEVRRVDLGTSDGSVAPPVTIVSVPAAPALEAAKPAAVPAQSSIESGSQGQGLRAPGFPAKADPGTQDPVKLASAPAALPPQPAVPAKPVATQDQPSIASSGQPKRVKSIRFGLDGEPIEGPTQSPVVQNPIPSATVAPATPPVRVSSVSVTAPPPPAAAAAPKAKPHKIAAITEPVREPNPTTGATPGAPLQIAPPSGAARKATKQPKEPAATAARGDPAAPVELARTTTSDEQVESPAEPAGRPSGGARKFSVQFGAPGSPAEAQSLISKLKSRYPSVMGPVSTRVLKAEVNGKSVYRVRSVPVTREEATSICGQMKAAGGACFISGA